MQRFGDHSCWKVRVAMADFSVDFLADFPADALADFSAEFWKRGKDPPPTPKISALLRKRPVLLFWPISSLLRTENGLTTDFFVVKCTGRGLVVKRPGVLSKVQMLNFVLGVGVFSLLSRILADFSVGFSPDFPWILCLESPVGFS